MCGDYHGGDGLKMIEWVDDLLAKTPAIYLGDEPFEHETKLAAQVAKKRSLKSAVATIEKRLADPDLDDARKAELERLHTAVVDYRDRMTKSAEDLLATRPSRVVASLKDLQKELAGTSLDDAVGERIAELATSKALKTAIDIEKKFGKVVRSLEKRKPCKACDRKGHESLNADCAVCKDEAKSALRKALKKLDTLVEGHEDLPIAATVKRYADTWRP